MKKTRLAFLLGVAALTGVFWAMGVRAEESRVYTLEESLEEAFANNWQLKAEEERIAQARFVQQQARADFFPKLSMSYGYTRLDQENYLDLPMADGRTRRIVFAYRDNYQLRGTVSQPIFTGFALTSTYRLAELGIDQSGLEVALAKLDLALQVKEAYFNVLIADKAVDVTEKQTAALESNLEVTQSFYDVGIIPVNDLLKVEVDLGNAQQELVSARNAARLARAAFNVVLARPVEAPAEVADILAYRPEGVDFERMRQAALEKRPEIILVDNRLQQVAQEMVLVKSRYYPEVAFNYDYVKQGDSITVSGYPFEEGDFWEASVGLSWTFWEWKKTHYQVKEKESLQTQILKIRKALEEQIGFEVKEAILRLENAVENIPTTQKAVAQGEENLRVNEERYKAQVNTITNVLDAQFQLTRARVNYYRALYNFNLARANLKRAVGTY